MARERKPGPIQQLALIDGFVIDCLLNETHQLDNEVTEFPVEDGSTISDNIRPKPLVVQMECVISDTPLEFAGLFRPKTSIPTDDAYSLLKTIRQQRRLIEIDTSLEHYKNMAVESLSIPRSAGRGDDLRFSATFKQVELVQNIRGERTRVATPQGVPPAQQEYRFTKTIGTNHVMVDVANGTWYDADIGAMRLKATFEDRKPEGTIAALVQIVEGRWILDKFRPVWFTKEEYDNRLVAENQDFVLRQEIAKRRKLRGEPLVAPGPRTFRWLSPAEYTIRGFTRIN